MYQLNGPDGVVRLLDGASIPFDERNADYREYAAWLAAGNTPLPALSPDPHAVAVAQVQKRLDDFAQTRGYDGILSACTYAASAVPQFAAEGQYCMSARDAHWSKCYEILNEINTGVRPMPTLDQFLAALPPLAWPA